MKKGIDAEQSRRRRDDTQIQIRKAKREEGLQKRRAMKPESNTAPLASVTSSTTTPSCAKKVYCVSDIPTCLALLQNPNSSHDDLMSGIQGFRKMLSVERNPPVLEVLNAGALPVFISLLDAEDSKIQFEAAWTITNIASTEYTRVVVDYGAMPKLIQLLLSNDPNVREQCAWCLGNVAGDSTDLRDAVLNAGALHPL